MSSNSDPTETIWPWHPLSFWRVVLIFFITNLVCIAIVVALREGLGLGVPIAAAGGAGAVAALLIIGRMVRARHPTADP